MLKFLIFLSGFRRALAPRIDRWIQDGVFQLQRRAYEDKDGIVWKDLDKEIPITVDNELLVDLPIETRRLLSTHECEKCSSSSSGIADGLYGISNSSEGTTDELQMNNGAADTTTNEDPATANGHPRSIGEQPATIERSGTSEHPGPIEHAGTIDRPGTTDEP